MNRSCKRFKSVTDPRSRTIQEIRRDMPQLSMFHGRQSRPLSPHLLLAQWDALDLADGKYQDIRVLTQHHFHVETRIWRCRIAGNIDPARQAYQFMDKATGPHRNQRVTVEHVEHAHVGTSRCDATD